MAKIIGFKGLTQRVEKLESASGNSGGGSLDRKVLDYFGVESQDGTMRDYSTENVTISLVGGISNMQNVGYNTNGGLHFFGDNAVVDNVYEVNIFSGADLSLGTLIQLENKTVSTSGSLVLSGNEGSYLKDCLVMAKSLILNTDFYGGILVFSEMGDADRIIGDETLLIQRGTFGQTPLTITWPQNSVYKGTINLDETFNLIDIDGTYIIQAGKFASSFFDEMDYRLSQLEQKVAKLLQQAGLS